jgi:fluoride ion exporter CrcB/FEX
MACGGVGWEWRGLVGVFAGFGAFLRFLLLVHFLASFGAEFPQFGAFLKNLVQKFG